MHTVDRERLPESADLRISQLRHRRLFSVSALLQKDWRFHRQKGIVERLRRKVLFRNL